jgi:hypothetical protein
VLEPVVIVISDTNVLRILDGGGEKLNCGGRDV